MCGIALGGNFVQFLGGHHSLVVQVLYAFVRFFGNGKSCPGFLPYFVGCLYLFLAGAFQGFFVLGLCGGFGSTGLFQFCLHIWSFENGKRISCLHALSLFHPELQDTSRYFARYAILCYFGLPLYDFRPFAQHEETYEGNDGDYSRQGEECQQHVTVL